MSARGHVEPRLRDDVESPSHYAVDGVPFECIDVIRAALTPEEFLGFLRGNVLKYQFRARRKSGTAEGFAKDMAKARWYAGRAEEAAASAVPRVVADAAQPPKGSR